MKPAARRRLGIATGLVLGAITVACLSAPGLEHLHAPGPMNTGHAGIACEGCHREAPGTVRQQLQAAARDVTGLHAGAVDVGFQAVTSDACTTCHERPDDRHPGSRFLEPRFAEVRAALHPEQCTACHREHAGVRVTIAEPTYCRHCHGELVVERDPIDVPHADLVAAERWETCLGCHDYHGNHAFPPPARLDDARPLPQLRAYFDGGPSPYGPPLCRATTPEVTSP